MFSFLSNRLRACGAQRACLTLALLFAPVIVTTAPARAETHAGTETRVVDQLQDGLVNILHNSPDSASGGRSTALGNLLSETFDINTMGAIAVGLETYRAWSPEQRQRFLEAFARFMVASHANRLEGTADKSFEIEGSEDAQSNRKIVHARYVRAGHDPVSVDYLVQMTKNGWRILDVYLDGTVSLLALHRSEFTSVLRNEGFDGFIAAMNAKADELSSTR